jgi:integrase
VHLAGATVRVVARRKGAGAAARTLPLSTLGVAAFRAFDQANAYGAFTVQNVNLSFQRACTRLNITGLTLYDLRHAFGAQLYRVTRDLATVGRLLSHANLSTTARYAEAANQDVDVQAVDRFAAAVSEGRKVPPQGARRQKSKPVNQLRRAR